jgi:hypothetical protein
MSLTRPQPVQILRFGFALVFIWFSAQQFSAPSGWVTFVPEWMNNPWLKPETIILINAWFEAFAAWLLIMGFFLKPINWLLAGHTLLIAFEAGGAIAARDVGLAVGCVAMALSLPDVLALDYQLNPSAQLDKPNAG